MVACGVNFFLQLTGNTFANKYGTIYNQPLHSVDPYLMTVVNQLINLLGAVVSMSLVDRWRRRHHRGAALSSGSGSLRAGLRCPRILTAEVLSSRLRGKTYRTASAVYINIEHSPPPPSGDEGKATVVAFFCVPECKGRTLEEVGRLFLDKGPFRKLSQTRVPVVRGGDDRGDLEKEGSGARVSVVESEQV
ncbi:hypothetical protein DL769_007883 [Monosporascus sp. CRB-8-3]|nr:hypothetical protein DL769_007883 [Monosporascus sp. CRB-8-3]